MFNWLRARLGGITAKPMRGLAMVANWLENVKWTIEYKFLPLAQQAFGQNEVVYACIRLLSQSIPEPPLVAYQLDPERGTKTPLPYNHDLSRLIKRPNKLMTEFEFWELLSIHNAIVGRSCWWKERNRMGVPIALWPMRPDRVGPLYDEYKVIRGWAYQVPGSGTIVELPAEDVAAFNFPDPTGESGGIVEGYGPIQALAKQIASDNEATKFVGALLANYAAPTVVIKVKAPIADEDEAALIKAKFRHEFGGANRGTPAVLDAETDIEAIGFNLQELEFDLLRNISESRISAALGVPAILVGLRVGLREGNNRASVTEQRAFFAETTLSHHWRRYQDQYTEDVASEFGENIVCEFDTLKVKAMASHIQERLKPIVEAFKNGAITRNQYLMALNLPLLPPVDGDLFLVPSSAVAVPLGAGSATALPTGEPQTGGEVGQPIGVLEHGKSAIKAKADFEYQTDAEEELAAIIAAVLAIYWERAVTHVREGQAFPYEELSAALIATLEPELARIALAQAEREAASTTIGFDPAGMARQVNEWASSYVSGLVAGLIETTRGVVEGARNRPPEITDDQLRELLRAGFDEKRAQAIGVTETTAAIVGGVLAYDEYVQRLGVRDTLEFRTARDDRVCPLCRGLDGTKQGSVGFVLPPIHTLCRCYLVRRQAR